MARDWTIERSITFPNVHFLHIWMAKIELLRNLFSNFIKYNRNRLKILASDIKITFKKVTRKKLNIR